jgi:hypothetical protein
LANWSIQGRFSPSIRNKTVMFPKTVPVPSSRFGVKIGRYVLYMFLSCTRNIAGKPG